MHVPAKNNVPSNQQRNKTRGRSDERSHPPSVDDTEHEGATEDQVNETPAPAGYAFDDEPKQG